MNDERGEASTFISFAFSACILLRVLRLSVEAQIRNSTPAQMPTQFSFSQTEVITRQVPSEFKNFAIHSKNNVAIHPRNCRFQPALTYNQNSMFVV